MAEPESNSSIPDSSMPEPSILSRDSDGATIAYYRTEGHRPESHWPESHRPEGRSGADNRGGEGPEPEPAPGVVFLPGFRSDMEGGKALAVEAWCRREGCACLRFDYTGHGKSSGRFEDGTIGQWAADAIYAIESLTEGPQVLVGSSMGGWIMMLVARALPDRIAGLVGIAPAPDFTLRLEKEATDAMRAAWEKDGVWHEPSQYSDEPTPFTRALIDDGVTQQVLDKPFPFDGPVRIIQGMEDPDVPWQHALAVANAITSEDIEVRLVKSGDHRLSEPDDIDRLTRVVGEVCGRIGRGGSR